MRRPIGGVKIVTRTPELLGGTAGAGGGATLSVRYWSGNSLRGSERGVEVSQSSRFPLDPVFVRPQSVLIF